MAASPARSRLRNVPGFGDVAEQRRRHQAQQQIGDEERPEDLCGQAANVDRSSREAHRPPSTPLRPVRAFNSCALKHPILPIDGLHYQGHTDAQMPPLVRVECASGRISVVPLFLGAHGGTMPKARVPTLFLALVVATATALAVMPDAHAAVGFEVESLDGSGNNISRPDAGAGGREPTRGLPRPATPTAAAQPVTGPNSRYVSNRVFNDAHQNIFSEHRVTQWGWTWGQFLDHTFGLAAGGTESAQHPVQRHRSAGGRSPTRPAGSRSPATVRPPAPGSPTRARQVNTVSSYIDALGRLRRHPRSGSNGCGTGPSTTTWPTTRRR